MQQLRRIAKKENPNIKISKKALIALAKHLERHTGFIFRKAAGFAKGEKRKIIEEKDIENAIKEKSLLEL